MKNKKKREAAKKKKDEANNVVEKTEKTEVQATGDPEKDKKIRNISKVKYLLDFCLKLTYIIEECQCVKAIMMKFAELLRN